MKQKKQLFIYLGKSSIEIENDFKAAMARANRVLGLVRVAFENAHAYFDKLNR